MLGIQGPLLWYKQIVNEHDFQDGHYTMGAYSIISLVINFTLYFSFFLTFISYSCNILLQLPNLIKVTRPPSMYYSFPWLIIKTFIYFLLQVKGQ